MGYYSWTTGIYNEYDAHFKYHESCDEARWLYNIIKKELGDEYLFNEEGEYRFKPKDEYEGFHRSKTTEGVEKEMD